MKCYINGAKAPRLAAFLLSLAVCMTTIVMSDVSPCALEQNGDTADIFVRKTMLTISTEDSYTFRLEPVEACTIENEDPSEDGMKIGPADMPMPEDVSQDQLYKDIVIGGFSGSLNTSKTSGFGPIRFSQPGWYMYRVTELIPENSRKDIRYDRDCYYAVVYAEYAEETGDAVKVSSVTGWHNEEKSSKHLPDFSDISSVTDNGGKVALENEETNTYGKTDYGVNTVTLDFTNSQETGSLSITKKVTGLLGDTSKEFGFSVELSGLASVTDYQIVNNGAVLGDGFSGECFRTDGEGRAELHFKLKSNTGFSFEGLPEGAGFEVTEEMNDHDPGFTVKKDDEEIASETLYTQGALSTGKITSDAGSSYCVEFVNTKSAAPVTGVVAESGTWWTGMGLTAIAAAMAYIYACIRGSIRKNGNPTTFS